jgi:hypothetical protein
MYHPSINTTTRGIDILGAHTYHEPDMHAQLHACVCLCRREVHMYNAAQSICVTRIKLMGYRYAIDFVVSIRYRFRCIDFLSSARSNKMEKVRRQRFFTHLVK